MDGLTAPGEGEPDPPSTPSRPPSHRGRTRQAGPVLVSALGLALGLGALVALAAGSVHLARQTTSVTAPAQVRQDTRDADYYRCLTVQAQSLVRPGQTVRVEGDLSTIVTLGKVVGGWTAWSGQPHLVQLSLEPVPTGGCLGVAVVARFPSAGGGPPVVRVGHGASLSGPPLPL